MKIDVKTTGRSNARPYYAHNFGLSKDFIATLIYFALCKRTSELYIDGWVTKEELFERSKNLKKDLLENETTEQN